MSARAVRLMLALALLAMSLGSVGPAGAAGSAWEKLDAGALTLDGLAGAGHTRVLDSSLLDVARSEGESFRTPQVIVGPDTRTQVTDTAQFPYSAVAHLELYEVIGDDSIEQVAGCTGALVGPNVLLTAAHCLWDEEEFGGWIDGVIVVPGANGDNEPFGFDFGSILWIPDEYPGNSEPGSLWDYGLVILASNQLEQQTGSFEIGVLTTAELQSASFEPTTSGYPGDKPFATQWVSSEAAFDAVDDLFLEHSIDSIQGQSGSPVWRGSDHAVVGVESWESESANYAVRVSLPVIYELMGACLELGCQLNHFLSDVPGDGGAYDRVRDRTDLAVASGAQARTWMWGPAPITKIMLEPYAEAPDGFRTVLYQEKSRMEITAPFDDPNSIWYVTNGLLTVELMTGMLQLGNDQFEQYSPAEINVAGDSDDPDGPTYVTFAGLRSLPAHPEGSTITATVDRAGQVGDDPSLAGEGVTAAHLAPETGHAVASVFWDFMNSSGLVWQDGQFVQDQLFENPFFATGFPITEAYWARVRIGGGERVVLVQAFERRVLTYTPGNPEGFLVEAGNVGMHYHHWRYTLIPAESGVGGGPGDPSPPIGQLIASADFANWPDVETTFGDVGMPLGDSYQVSNPPTGFLQVVGGESFGDAYYTLDVRMTLTGGLAAGCLVYRADPMDENPLFNNFAYWICMIYDGPNALGIGVFFETATSTILLAGADLLTPLPANEWRQIGVIAQGQTFWVVADGETLGSFEHDVGPGSGQVGILTLNLSDTEGDDVTFELRSLEIYALAS